MELSIEKPKRKIRTYQAPSDSFLTFLGIKPTQFDFIVGLPLWECKERVEFHGKTRGFWGWLFGDNETTVEVWPVSTGSYEFRLLKRQPKHRDILVCGTLNAVSDYTSTVSGQIGASHAYGPVTFFVLLLGAALVASTIAVQLLLAVLLWSGMIWLLDTWNYEHDRQGVLERFQNALLVNNLETSKPKRE